ncbi:MAG: hypothetical protein K2Y37_08225 [Pirellulales bacterium]|nr:hypothetical protein [Pirellulales bacterium]
MDKQPKRHWFRFRLSTWLVLFTLLPAYAGGVIKFLTTIAVGGSRNISRGPIDDGWPMIFLVIFLAWKAAWVVGPRLVRRRRSVAP